MDDIELDRRVLAFLEAEYDRLERGENINPEPQPDIDSAYSDARRIAEFLQICRNPKQHSLVKEWLEEYGVMNESAVAITFPQPQVVYFWKILEILSQHKGADLSNTAQIRKLLVSRESGHIERGLKVLQSAREGHKSKHGSWEEKRKRWKSYQAEVDKLHAEFPTYSHNKLCEIASKQLGVPARTIRYRTRY
ncbi:MAG: hypothetical protein ACREVK_10965 [Gammaproteobacteria bacterium]